MKVMVFSPNAAIWQHALPEGRLARALIGAGHDVYWLSCGAAQRGHCTSMEPFGIGLGASDAQKASVCKLCKRNAATLVNALGVKNSTLADFLTPDDHAAHAEIMQDVTSTNYVMLEWEGVCIGKLATYESLLKFKKMATTFEGAEWEFVRVYVSNALLGLMAFKRIFDAVRPERLLVYSPQYGLNGVCSDYATRRGCRVYFVEGSASNAERYSALRVWHWNTHKLENPALSHWKNSATITTPEILRLRGHFVELLRAKSFAVYSAPLSSNDANQTVRQKFAVPCHAKVLLLCLSSFDEAFAAHAIGAFRDIRVRGDVFKNQFEWVSHTLESFAHREDVIVIIRMHPRDFANKREGRSSEQAEVWDQLLRELPSNARINAPTDGISLYNMLREVDVVVTGWSATGVEALLVGLPVVTYDQALPSYPKEIHFTGVSKEAYVANIDAALAKGRSLEFAVGGFLWLALSFSRGTVRIAPPLPLDKIFRVVPLRGLRRMVRELLEPAIKWLDARRGFGPHGEEERFLRLIETPLDNLIEAEPSIENDATSAYEAIVREHAQLCKLLAISPAREVNSQSMPAHVQRTA